MSEENMKSVHLMLGREDDYHTVKSKTGCGLTGGNAHQYVYYRNRKAVTCPLCVERAYKIACMRGEL